MTARRLWDEDITNSLFDDNGDYISNEIVDDDYIPSDDYGEIDELITDLVPSDEEDYIFSKYYWARPYYERNSRNFTSRNKSETWTTVPDIVSEGWLGIHNIVRERSGPTNYANVSDMASVFYYFLVTLCFRKFVHVQTLK